MEGNFFVIRDAQLSFRARALIFEERKVSVRAYRTSPPMYPVVPVLTAISAPMHKHVLSSMFIHEDARHFV